MGLKIQKNRKTRTDEKTRKRTFLWELNWGNGSDLLIKKFSYGLGDSLTLKRYNSYAASRGNGEVVANLVLNYIGWYFPHFLSMENQHNYLQNSY